MSAPNLIINADNYRAFPAVANSDFTWLEELFMPEEKLIDLTKAFAHGTLIDCMITEQHRVNYFKHRVAGENYAYTKDDFETAKRMKESFFKDEFCRDLVKNCDFQHITYRPEFEIEYEGFKFTLPVKCKWDLRHKNRRLKMGGDIKSTVATTEKQCRATIDYFNYDRSRAWYMDLDETDNDILIFISKISPYRIFKIPIRRGDALYEQGKKKYQELAYKWWYLFHDFNHLIVE